MVEQGQGVPKIGPKLMNPRSRPAIRLLHGALGIASLPAIRDLVAKTFSREPEAPDLSRYDHLAADDGVVPRPQIIPQPV